MLSFESTQLIYRNAIDAQARDDEPASWWEDVSREIREVMSARSNREAAALIAWWHHDWSAVPDTTIAAARRIRRAARAMKSKTEVGA